MVTFQTLLSPNPLPPPPHNHHHNPYTISEFENNPSNKRKWDETEPHNIKPWMNTNTNPNPKTTTTHSSSATDLHLEIPLPSNLQRSLDIQSGDIHLYNTTHKRRGRDPRVSETTPLPAPIPSIDLELNLTCGDHHSIPATKMNNKSNISANKKNRSTLSLFSSSSPAAADMDQQDMVAAACKRCHLLVMLCKSYPACPNCKFMHPPEQSPSNLLKPRLSLLC